MIYAKLLQNISNISRPNFTRLYSAAKTIFALSSGQGKCGVAVIRISGQDSENALKTITRMSELPKPRIATLRTLYHPENRESIDRGLILWFPGPRSYTGEDSFELHVHGGPAVINSVLSALVAMPGLRLARAGEFTQRAFFHGKLDLTEVEGLADLLQSETEQQRKQAFLQTQGALGRVYKKWRASLLRAIAHMEALIDFDETETIDDNITQEVQLSVLNLTREIATHLSDGRKGETLRSGAKTVIIGEPNVGKSSLFNLLCQRPAAIVTPIAGTTRDAIETTLNIGGYPLVLIDTAGLRAETSDLIELEGMNRALDRCCTADLVLVVIDAMDFVKSKKSFRNYVENYLRKLRVNNILHDGNGFKNLLIILNKIDQVDDVAIDVNDAVLLSCISEKGTSNLVKSLTNILKNICGEPSEEHPSMTHTRHRQHLSNCLNSLNTFLQCLENPNCDLVLTVEHLKRAVHQLGQLVGVITTEQMLDVIFKDFCIGK